MFQICQNLDVFKHDLVRHFFCFCSFSTYTSSSTVHRPSLYVLRRVASHLCPHRPWIKQNVCSVNSSPSPLSSPSLAASPRQARRPSYQHLRWSNCPSSPCSVGVQEGGATTKGRQDGARQACIIPTTGGERSRKVRQAYPLLRCIRINLWS